MPAVNWLGSCLVAWESSMKKSSSIGVGMVLGSGIVLSVELATVALVPGYRSVVVGALERESFREGRPVSFWIDGLTSRQAEIREHAAHVLGQNEPDNPAVIPALV